MSTDQAGYDYSEFDATVNEPTASIPVPKGKYQVVLARLEMVDPVLKGWKPRTNQKTGEEEPQTPFLNADYQILADEAGEPVECAGRYVRGHKVDTRPGHNPKTGEALRKVLADLLRVKHGLGPKDEPLGLSLFDGFDVKAACAGLSREEQNATINAELKRGWEGLQLVISVRNWKGDDGVERNSVGGIIVGERA